MAEEEDVIVEKKGGSKLLLIIALVLGIGMGGGGAYFYLSELDQEPMVDEEEVEEEILMMDVPIDGVRMPIFDNRGRYSGTIKIRVNLKVGAGEDVVLTRGFSSQLKHEFLSVLAKMEPPTDDNQSVHDPDYIAGLLTPVAKRVLGDIKVYEIFVDDLQFESR